MCLRHLAKYILETTTAAKNTAKFMYEVGDCAFFQFFFYFLFLYFYILNFLRLFFCFWKDKLSSEIILRPVIGFMANFKILFFCLLLTFILCLQNDKSKLQINLMLHHKDGSIVRIKAKNNVSVFLTTIFYCHEFR